MSIARGFSLLALLFVMALPASAQVCTPPCTGSTECAYTDSTRSATECRAQGLLNERSSGPSGPTFADMVNGVVVPVIDFAVMPLLYAIAFVVFLIGMVRLFFSDNEEKRKSGRQFALWGIIGFAVLFSIWGIVRLFLTLLPGGGA